MSHDVSEYFPNYQLRKESSVSLLDNCKRIRKVEFLHNGVYFVAKVPFFGATETQKKIMNWAYWHDLPPVISVKHGKPTQPDSGSFSPDDLHVHYHPYAMAIVTIECLGEKEPRKIKIYFCEIEVHEENIYNHQHSKGMGTYIVPL